MKKICILFLSLVITSSIQAGGPWPQPKGKAYIKLYEWWINFDQHYVINGNKEGNPLSSIYNTGVFAEYGITDKFTVVLNIPFNSQFKTTFYPEFSAPINFKYTSVGDSELGIKYGITKKNSVMPVSASLIVGLPFGKDKYTGDGEMNQLFQLETGRSYKISNKISGFTSLLAAYNIRSNGYSDEFRFGVETGLALFHNNLNVIARYYNLNSMHNHDKDQFDNHYLVSIFENDTEYSSYSIEFAYYFLKRLGISFNYASAFRGEWIAAAPAYSVGLFYDFNR